MTDQGNGHLISEDTIRGFLDTAEPILSASPQMNEANTKKKIIEPFLQDVLSWRVQDMELEYSVQFGGQQHRVDYALMVDSAPNLFVEAKGGQTTLGNTTTQQLRSYMKVQDVTLGLLTNGKAFQLYHLEFSAGNSEFHCVLDAQLSDLVGERQVLSAIARQSIPVENGRSKIAQMRKRNLARQELEDRKDEIAETVSDTITNETDPVIYQDAEQEALELVDRLIRVLDPSGSVEDTNQETPDEDSVDNAGKVRQVTLGDGNDDSPVSEYQVTLSNDGTVVEVFENEVQATVMADVVEYLVEEHALVEAVGPLPYVPGKSKIALNDTVEYPDSEKVMKAPTKLSCGLYVNTHYSGGGKLKFLNRVATACGLDLEFGPGW